MTEKQTRIFYSICRERERQKDLIKAGKILHPCEDREVANFAKLAVLAEEFGEVAKAACDMELTVTVGKADLKRELIQVAAVAVAWLESFD